jgi:hypothetical protein
MYVPAQRRAIGVVHCVDNAGSHTPSLLGARSRRGGLRFRLPTAEHQRRNPNQYTSTQTSVLDFHNPPSYRIYPASPINADADSTIEKPQRHHEKHVEKIDLIRIWLPAPLFSGVNLFIRQPVCGASLRAGLSASMDISLLRARHRHRCSRPHTYP